MKIPSVRGLDLGERSSQEQWMENKTKTEQNGGTHLTSAPQTHEECFHSHPIHSFKYIPPPAID